MINYTDSTYYTGTYLVGKEAVIDTASFDYYARKATQIIKAHTFNRVNEASIQKEVKMCCCELAEIIFKYEKTEDNGNIASEKVGEYNVSYVDKDKQDQLHQSKCNMIVSSWLAYTGLLYRGCC